MLSYLVDARPSMRERKRWKQGMEKNLKKRLEEKRKIGEDNLIHNANTPSSTNTQIAHTNSIS